LYIGRQHRLLIKIKAQRTFLLVRPVSFFLYVLAKLAHSISSGKGLANGILSAWGLMKWREESDTHAGKS